MNVGRGGVVDEDALVDALRNGRLRGAALDVFAHEPLPPDSPLWELDNVILSPHTAALSRHENERIVELFAGQPADGTLPAKSSAAGSAPTSSTDHPAQPPWR